MYQGSVEKKQLYQANIEQKKDYIASTYIPLNNFRTKNYIFYEAFQMPEKEALQEPSTRKIWAPQSFMFVLRKPFVCICMSSAVIRLHT